jgi:hypothetical protein
VTPLQIETAARRMLNAEGSTFWSSEEIIQSYLYFCCMELANEARCTENRYTTSSVASQQEYSVAALALEIRRVEYNGKGLQCITLEQYNTMVPPATGTLATGTPLYYWLFDEVMGLYPIPDSVKTIKIYTYDFPDALTSSSSLPIPVCYHPHLVTGVVSKMVTKELGHPMISLYGEKWEIAKAEVAKREKWRRWRSSSRLTQREEDLSTTQWGVI